METVQATMTYMRLLNRGRLEDTRVIPERTEVVWGYRPADFFEAPYRRQETEYDLLIEAGKAVATLQVAQDPVEARLMDSIQQLVENLCKSRQVQVYREYDVEGLAVYQHAGDRKSVTAFPRGLALATGIGALRVDTTVRDAAGNVLRDTKAERIAKDTLDLDLLASKLPNSSLLRIAVKCYSRAVSDPSNELVHLYGVRDVLAEHFGGEGEAYKALNISGTEWGWDWLGRLANDPSIEQGRHRSNDEAGRRSATASELQEAREIVRRWIIAFGRVV